MAFGSSAKPVAPKDTTSGDSKDIFFDTKVGQRSLRLLPGDEIRLRSLFFAREPDGTWVPTFGYDQNDRRAKKPITIAVYDAANESWVYGGEWGSNPVDLYVASLDVSEETRKTMYAKEKFYIAVLDRTRVKVLPDGSVCMPDTRGQFPKGTESIVAQRVNKVKILQGSSGTPLDKDGNWQGKHLYRELLETVDGQLDEMGSPRNPTTYDLRLLTSGKGIDTKRQFSVEPGTPEDIDWAEYKTFDLRSWVKPWSFTMIDRFMNGKIEYNDAMKDQGIDIYPREIDIDMGEAVF